MNSTVKKPLCGAVPGGSPAIFTSADMLASAVLRSLRSNLIVAEWAPSVIVNVPALAFHTEICCCSLRATSWLASVVSVGTFERLASKVIV